MESSLLPVCVRCAKNRAVTFVRAKLGHRDAVCFSCTTNEDEQLPFVWPLQKLGCELVPGDVVCEADGFLWKVTAVESISVARLRLTLEPVFPSMTARGPVKQTLRKLARVSLAEVA